MYTVCTDMQSPSMVFEYMRFGDLAALLQSNDPCSGIIPRIHLTQVPRVMTNIPVISRFVTVNSGTFLI